MAMEQQHEVVIVGAGIAGVATALALKRVGITSLVLERSEELRTTGAALTLAPNAWRALDALGVAHKLCSLYQAFQIGRVTNLETGVTNTVSFTPSRERVGLEVRNVHRKVLLESLAEELPPETIRFSSKLSSIKTTEVVHGSPTTTILHLEDGTVIRTKVLIGCDGVHSVVAQWLGLCPPIHSGRSAVRGLSVFSDGHGFKHEVLLFLAIGKRAGFVPLNDKEVYWFMIREKEMPRDPESIVKEITHLAKDFPSDYLNVVRHSDLSTLSWAPLMFRKPWDLIMHPILKGNVTVAGDAMHPMTPDLGQGGCSALEDAVVLARNLVSSRTAHEGIEKYVRERRWRGVWLITGSFLSGWVQQGGEGMRGWMVRWFRDNIFYRFLFTKIADAANYDCGDLPTDRVKGWN